MLYNIIAGFPVKLMYGSCDFYLFPTKILIKLNDLILSWEINPKHTHFEVEESFFIPNGFLGWREGEVGYDYRTFLQSSKQG